MGYDEFYLIGMDGTSQQRELAGTDEEGKSNVPHFYDEHPGKDSMLWDIAWGNIAHFLAKKGKSITNLSTETAITQIERRSYLDYWNPDTGMWKRPWGCKYPGSAALLAACLCNEFVAGAPQDGPGALDGVGHMVFGGGASDFTASNKDSPKQKDKALSQEYLRGGLYV